MKYSLQPAGRRIAPWLACLLAACSTTGGSIGNASLSDAQVTALVASPDRSAADRANDARRKPVDTLEFIGLHPGMTALDVSAGGGYTTELLARAIGPTGRVYAQVRPPQTGAQPRPAAPEGDSAPMPTRAAPAAPAAPRAPGAAVTERASRLKGAGAAAAPIDLVVQPFDNPVPPQATPAGLDLVTLMFNYHDLGFMGVDRAQMNRSIFLALKPGGLYVIADHAGRPGTGISESGTLHRIEELFLRQEVEAAGFKWVGEGTFLRNPNDPRDRNTPEPPQPKDEFVLKFMKPT